MLPERRSLSQIGYRTFGASCPTGSPIQPRLAPEHRLGPGQVQGRRSWRVRQGLLTGQRLDELEILQEQHSAAVFWARQRRQGSGGHRLEVEKSTIGQTGATVYELIWTQLEMRYMRCQEVRLNSGTTWVPVCDCCANALA